MRPFVAVTYNSVTDIPYYTGPGMAMMGNLCFCIVYRHYCRRWCSCRYRRRHSHHCRQRRCCCRRRRHCRPVVIAVVVVVVVVVVVAVVVVAIGFKNVTKQVFWNFSEAELGPLGVPSRWLGHVTNRKKIRVSEII